MGLRVLSEHHKVTKGHVNVPVRIVVAGIGTGVKRECVLERVTPELAGRGTHRTRLRMAADWRELLQRDRAKP